MRTTPATAVWASRKAAEARRQIDELAGTPAGSDWRQRQRKARTLAMLRARESRLRALTDRQVDDFQYPF